MPAVNFAIEYKLDESSVKSSQSEFVCFSNKKTKSWVIYCASWRSRRSGSKTANRTKQMLKCISSIYEASNKASDLSETLESLNYCSRTIRRSSILFHGVAAMFCCCMFSASMANQARALACTCSPPPHIICTYRIYSQVFRRSNANFRIEIFCNATSRHH